MKIKAKKFSHKLLALFLAVVMGMTCFTGALNAFGASVKDYTDENIEYNDLAWSVLSDEQTATALLDYADKMLADFGPQIDKLLKGALPSSGLYFYDASKREIGINAAGIIKANVKVYTHSVDEILETIESLASVISSYGGLLGDAGNIQLSSTDGMRRSKTSSCDIIRGVLAILQKNSADYNGKDVIGQFLRGGFSLGTVGNLAKVDIYSMLGGALNLEDGYQSNFVYNLVKSLLFNNTNWFTEDEKIAYNGGGQNSNGDTIEAKTFVFDDVLLEKMTTELLDKIKINVTYPDGTSSESRKALIDAKMAEGLDYKAAASALGYDPDLIYSSEEGYEGHILLFAYGEEMLKLTTSDSLFSFGYQALGLAWKTVLKDTVKLLHVNNNVDRGHGTNFDNVYYYWATDSENPGIAGGWDQNNLTEMYSQENINKWADAMYEAYGAKDRDEFLGWVKNNYEFDRSIAEGATGKWSDIDETTLFNKIRYSPLADYGFNMQTGPINLYFMQTGTNNLDEFFEGYSSYSSLVGGLNDCLVAAVKDIFVDRDNIYKDKAGDTDVPVLETVNPSSIDSAAIKSITETLVGNALKIVQYTADTTDKNILNGFYKAKGDGTQLSESNLEEAMVPLLIACIGQINLGSGKLERVIHPADWDKCKDAESVIFVCLREYLSYILPEKDYNQLVVIGDDIQAKPGQKMLDDVILPMARDAVVYVMQGYVPVSGTDGTRWQVEKKTVDDSNTIFDLLNSVICYYGDDYDMAKSDDRAMGVASLLGICDKQGNSLVNTENTIWENIDLVANKLLPVAGTLQGTGYGQFSSEKLLYNDIIKGALNISDTHSGTNMCGVSNFIYQFLTIVSADPIQKTPIVTTVYDLAKDLFNGLLGARYEGQTFTAPVPNAATSHPFDDLLQKEVLAGTDGSDIGVLQKLICNFVEFSGYGTKGLATYPDSILRGLMFALQAVNSFIPEAIDNISEHALKMATAEFTDSAKQGCQNGATVDSSVVVTNNVTGLNNAYVDGMSDSVEQLSRYYIVVTDTEINGTSTATIESSSGEDIIAPGESMSFATHATYVAGEDNSSSYEATITYDITDADGTPIYEGLKVTAYQYLTGAKSWQEVVYPSDRNGMLNSALENDSSDQTMNQDGYNAYTTSTFASNRLNCGYPEYVVLATSDLGAIANYQIRFRNTTNSLIGRDAAVDGLFYYDDKSVHDDMTNGDVQVGSSNAIPVWDKATGDLLRKELYDYSTDNGLTWKRGDNNNDGYDENRIGEIFSGLGPEEKAQFKQRDHVAYTLEEATAAGILQAYHKNDAGVYEYMYLKTGGGTNYDTTLSQISMRGPADGFYINFGKITVSKGKSQYAQFCKYDGSTPVQAGEYQVKICLYNSTGPGYLNFKLVVGDNVSADALDTKYKELSDLLVNYRESDFTNPQVYTAAKSALLNALATQSTVLTPTTAKEISDKTVLTASTNIVATEYGDRAFKPYTSDNNGVTTSPADMPVGVKADAYLGGSTVNGVHYGGVEGVYYFDANCTMPIYSNVPLTSTDVQDGKDKAGIAVIEGTGEDVGKYWLRNAPHYETEWDTTTYLAPWNKPTEVQAKDGNGALLYEQVQYVYRDAKSNKVNSDRDWKAKFPVTTYALVPNTGEQPDNRGTISQANDYLQYVVELVYGSVNTSIAQDLYEKVSLVRNGMNVNNFDVVTYNKMVEIAKRAEQKYTLLITYNVEEPVIDEASGQPQVGDDGVVQTQTVSKTDKVPFSEYNGYKNNPNIEITDVKTESTLSSVQVEEYVRLFDFYMSKVVERGYNGSQLEAEIKCASGNTYDNLKATPATYSDEGEIQTPAKVEKGTSAAEAKFGKWDENGTLVNKGEVVYTDETWNNYVTALAAAVDIAATGNGDYAHKNKAYYSADDKESYTAQVTDCYTADTNLQRAEIALTEKTVEEGHTVSASLVVAINPFGATNNVPVNGDYTVTVYDAGSEAQITEETFTMSKDNNTFKLTLPSGSYKATIKSAYSLTREDITITVGDSDIVGPAIPIIACDFNQDSLVSVVDAGVVYSQSSVGQESYCDLNGDDLVSVVDAGIVYACATGSPSLDPITIK